MHEKRMHSVSSYVTLTYDDAHLPEDWSLDISVHQKFIKRVRKSYGPGVKYLIAGEYGEQCRCCYKSRKKCSCPGGFDVMPGRPHYHAILFGVGFDDKRLHRVRNGHRLYTSAKLSKLWQDKGFCSIGEVTFDSACYVARYITKRKSGDAFKDWYEFVVPSTGEVVSRLPEYAKMSTGNNAGSGGLGAGFYRQYGDQLFRRDAVVINGVETTIPRYYERLRERENANQVLEIKRARKRDSHDTKWNRTPERLRVREECARSRVNLKRGSIDYD